jgi:hypothetical protein
LALPCNSEHDRSSYAMYKDNMGIDDRLELWGKSLRQPTRTILSDMNRTYYHDSYSRSLEYDWRVYDKIYAERYYILPKSTD